MIPISKPKNQHSVFRHRGFLCPDCNETTMVFGSDEPSKVCPECGTGGELIPQWDHKVTAQVAVEDWVSGAAQTPEAPVPASDPHPDTVSDPVT